MTKQEIFEVVKAGGQRGKYNYMPFIGGRKPNDVPNERLNIASMLDELFEQVEDKDALSDYKDKSLGELRIDLNLAIMNTWENVDVDFTRRVAEKYNVEEEFLTDIAVSPYGVYLFLEKYESRFLQ